MLKVYGSSQNVFNDGFEFLIRIIIYYEYFIFMSPTPVDKIYSTYMST